MVSPQFAAGLMPGFENLGASISNGFTARRQIQAEREGRRAAARQAERDFTFKTTQAGIENDLARQRLELDQTKLKNTGINDAFDAATKGLTSIYGDAPSAATAGGTTRGTRGSGPGAAFDPPKAGDTIFRDPMGFKVGTTAGAATTARAAERLGSIIQIPGLAPEQRRKAIKLLREVEGIQTPRLDDDDTTGDTPEALQREEQILSELAAMESGLGIGQQTGGGLSPQQLQDTQRGRAEALKNLFMDGLEQRGIEVTPDMLDGFTAMAMEQADNSPNPNRAASISQAFDTVMSAVDHQLGASMDPRSMSMDFQGPGQAAAPAPAGPQLGDLPTQQLEQLARSSGPQAVSPGGAFEAPAPPSNVAPVAPTRGGANLADQLQASGRNIRASVRQGLGLELDPQAQAEIDRRTAPGRDQAMNANGLAAAVANAGATPEQAQIVQQVEQDVGGSGLRPEEWVALLGGPSEPRDRVLDNLIRVGDAAAIQVLRRLNALGVN